MANDAETRNKISGKDVDDGKVAGLKLTLLIPLLLLILTLLISAWPRQSEQQLISLADATNNAGRLTEAYAKYQQAVTRDPNNADLHLKIAEVLNKSKDFSQAVEELAKAQNLDPKLNLDEKIKDEKVARDEVGNLRSELAQSLIDVDLHPDFRDGWVRLAYLHYRLREDGAAKSALGNALALDPNYQPAVDLKKLIP
jgi:tetratricopeptide (TPR) repeat protein